MSTYTTVTQGIRINGKYTCSHCSQLITGNGVERNVYNTTDVQSTHYHFGCFNMVRKDASKSTV